MDLIRQEDRQGCSIACIAMMAGFSYGYTKECLMEEYPSAGSDGVDLHDAIQFLRRFGWEQCGYESFHYNLVTEGCENFPLVPIDGADVTWCVVLPSQTMAHSILMLLGGKILDPARDNPPESLTGYPKVESLRGFKRIY